MGGRLALLLVLLCFISESVAALAFTVPSVPSGKVSFAASRTLSSPSLSRTQPESSSSRHVFRKQQQQRQQQRLQRTPSLALFASTQTTTSTMANSTSTNLPLKEDITPNKQQQQNNKKKIPGSAELDWKKLGFEFRATNSHVRITYQEGTGWGQPELVTEPYLEKLHIGATALHYGQACFEGLKAFCHPPPPNDNDDALSSTVHLFRPTENAKRMQTSCRRILMPELPTDLFLQACQTVVQDNLEYVPPYGSGGALYIRPLLFGSGPRIGLQPADQYTFLILVIPVGDYYGGLSQTVHGRIVTDYDRAAPRGVGHVKVAGNYAADLLPNTRSKKAGYPIGLYLDAATQSYIDEFSTSNFVGIKYGNADTGEPDVYVTPKSSSALPSITNKSLMQLAKERLGMKVEQRPIPVEELEEFDEVFAVGTAVVATPVGSLSLLAPVVVKETDDNNKDEFDDDFDEDIEYKVVRKYEFGSNPDEVGPKTRELYNLVRAIQNGEAPAPEGWVVPVVG